MCKILFISLIFLQGNWPFKTKMLRDCMVYNIYKSTVHNSLKVQGKMEGY